MWGAIIGGGLSLLGNILGNNKSNRQKSATTAPAPDALSYDEAYSQAEDMMTPQYEQHQENLLQDMQTNQIGTGFYNQAPGDAIRADTLQDMDKDFQAQLAKTATNLQDRQFNRDYKKYQMEFNNQQYADQQQQQTFGNIGTGAAIGQQIGEGYGESGWGAGIGALAGWLFS